MTDLPRWPPRKGMSLAVHQHPPGGRCMVGRCYCTKCPGYVPIRQDSGEIASLLTKNNAKHAKSWAERDEPTWLDKQ